MIKLPKPSIQFSLAGLMLVTLVIAVIIRFRGSDAPTGTELTTRTVLLPYTQGLAQRSIEGSWTACTVIEGKGNYCYLEEAGHLLGTTAAWGESIGIQLPEALPADTVIELHGIVGNSGNRLHEMVPGEMVASFFAHPSSSDMLVLKERTKVGTLKIVSNDGKVIVAQLDVSLPMSGHDEPRELHRELRLDRVYRPDPFQSLPAKHERKP